MSNAIVILSPGFEEIEAVTVIDLLRRAEIEVLVVGLKEGIISGSHSIPIMTDAFIEDVDPDAYDILILPGGQPGSDNLKKNPIVMEWLKRRSKGGRKIAAICAAPTVLHQAGILKGRSVTSFPTEEGVFIQSNYSEDAVVKDNNIITSRGVGTAIDFALELIAELEGKEKARGIARRILHEVNI